MKRLVLDASVLVKLFLEEESSDRAERCVERAEELLAPDLVWVEAANVVWKRQQRGALTADEAAGVVADMLRLPLRIHASDSLVPGALDLAIRTGCTAYDGLYLALAVRSSAPLLTADRRLADALAATPLAGHVRWLDREG